ncbi:MAG: DUF1566 domain-containing protein [Epsilonproteobacteria bacterium]|nr:DUF1566 domain-containing protein [Campylobacterota bacterium]OIO17051.1 MAG: hypothetical protein AUJ81_02865 [Helicobacteraceae bacterium CG1_02_36_14]PIP09237.1 MAG: hypothetical protein COX50_12135 [Sulfurimonas sp. CG23_combo_of_CG06-09_8_20_14_all_36_33]PIS24650.1 MAG: hypothetical protein COT46_08755 [Sulfurimonas sp. CG08_land_8_20_14_0_20_36_33]PIU34999.1 MAG: hypothetical protein COT05_05415 [Sulfurimonas sp. CG07_land_8_20_14_0_80_36_56]PIV02979.1 MAG: hypothetical protein COS56_
MFAKILLLLLPLALVASEVIWTSDSKGEISEQEYSKAMREYIDKEYTKELHTYQLQEDSKTPNRTVSADNLMWQDDERVKTTYLDWEEASAYCKAFRVLGFDNWRLPTEEELFSTVDARKSPRAKEEFKNFNEKPYWAVAPLLKNAKTASYINFSSDKRGISYKSDKNYVRCVRTLK